MTAANPGGVGSTDLRRAIEIALRKQRLTATPRLEPDLSLVDDRPLAGVIAEQRPAEGLLVGVYDRPRAQIQELLHLNLSEAGALFVGPIGSGKTWALATTIATFRTAYPAGLVVVVDAAGGSLIKYLNAERAERASDPGLLSMTGDDVSAFTLLVDKLDASDLPAPLVDPVLIVVDGFGELVASLARFRALGWIERLARLVIRGRSKGLWFATATAQPGDLGTDMRGSLRHTISLGERPRRSGGDSGPPLSPGRGVERTGDEVQIFSPFVTETSGATGAAKAQLSDIEWPLRPAGPLHAGPTEVEIGRENIAGDPVLVELGRRSLVVLGPPDAGKTSLVHLIAHHLGPLPTMRGRDAQETLAGLQELRDEHPAISSNETYARAVLHRFFASAPRVDGIPVIAIDDGHLLRPSGAFGDFVNTCASHQLASFIVTADLGATNAHDWKTLNDLSSQVLFLCPSQATDVDDGARVVRDALRLRPGYRFRSGTGVFYSRRVQKTVVCYRLEEEAPTVDEEAS